MKATCQHFCRTVLFNASALDGEKQFFLLSIGCCLLMKRNFSINTLCHGKLVLRDNR